MHNHDCPCLRCDMLFQLGGIEVTGDWIDIDKDRPSSTVDDNFSRGRKRIDRDDYLIPWLQTNGIQCKVHRCRSGIDGKSVWRSNALGKLTLKALCLGAGS